MANMEDYCSKLEIFDTNDDIESKATKAKVGDNLAVITEKLENGNPFLLLWMIRQHALCETMFEDGWGNKGYEGDMLLSGIWYQHVPSQRGPNTSYKLTYSLHTYAYSHYVLKAKFSMLPIAIHKGNPWFSMPLNV
jgi:hypothetical protein